MLQNISIVGGAQTKANAQLWHGLTSVHWYVVCLWLPYSFMY